MSTPSDKPATAEVVDTKAVIPSPQPGAIEKASPSTWFRGVPPEDKLNRMYGFSRAICNAAFIAPIVRGDEASVFFLVSMAEDLGLQWTHGLRSIYPLVKRGKKDDGSEDQIRAGIQGDVALALLLGRKFKVKIKESTAEICTVWMQRPDEMMEFEDSFTAAEAKDLDLLGKQNWKYRKDMLRWRAIMRVARIVAADVLGGMHLPDELEEAGMERGDSSNGAFREQAERNRDKENPYHVGEAPDAETSSASPKANSEPVAEAKPNVVEMPSKPEPVKSEENPAPVETKPEESRSGQETLAEASSSGGLIQPSDAVKTALAEAKQDLDPQVQKSDPDKPQSLKAKLAEEYTKLTELYPKLSPATLENKFKDFMKGFLNVKALGKGSAEEFALLMVADEESRYRFLFRYLRALLTDYPTKLTENPHGLGTACGVAFRKFRKSMEEWVWTERCQRSAIDLMFAFKQEDTGGSDTVEYLEGVEVVNLAESDLWAFLQVALRTRDAYMLVDQWKASKVPVSRIVAAWGIQVDSAPLDGLNALLRGGKSRAEDEAPKAAPAPVEDASDKDLDDILSLFD